jgi:hypothetical protein
MPLKVKDRTYNSDDLRKLMYAVGGWAQGWDDVLWYLKAVAPHDRDLFRRERVQALVLDVEQLRRGSARFTTDYREVYKEITGLECRSCRPPRAAPAQALHLRHITDKWLEGLRFPATVFMPTTRGPAHQDQRQWKTLLAEVEERLLTREEALERAKHNQAPSRSFRCSPATAHFTSLSKKSVKRWACPRGCPPAWKTPSARTAGRGVGMNRARVELPVVRDLVAAGALGAGRGHGADADLPPGQYLPPPAR